MAIALVPGQSTNIGSNGTSATSLTATLPSATTAGNLLIAQVSFHNVATTFTAPSGWVSAVKVQAQTETLEIWYYKNTVGGQTTFLFSSNQAADAMGLIVNEWSGADTAAPLDLTASNSGSSVTEDSGTTGTTNAANELWIAAMAYGAGSNRTVSGTTNGFTLDQNCTTATDTGATHRANIQDYYKIVSSTGTANVSETLSSSASWVGAIATFKAAGAATSTPTATNHGQWPLAPLRSTQRVALTPRTHNAYTGVSEQDAVPAAAEQFYGDGTQASVMGRIHTAWPNSPARATTRAALTWKTHNSGTGIAENDLTSDPTGTLAEFYGLVATYGTVLADALIPLQGTSVASVTAQVLAPATLQSTSTLGATAQISAPVATVANAAQVAAPALILAPSVPMLAASVLADAPSVLIGLSAPLVASSIISTSAQVVSPTGDALVATALLSAPAQVLSPAAIVSNSLLGATTQVLAAGATLASSSALSAVAQVAAAALLTSSSTLSAPARLLAPAQALSSNAILNATGSVTVIALPGTATLGDSAANKAILADVALNRIGTTDTALSAAILADKAG